MQRYYSNIYWHFTGSPDVDWDMIKMPKQIKCKAKSAKHSKLILEQILMSKKLIAGKPEVIYGKLKTNSFCCVCDIPFKDLVQHSQYYGEVAIGFSANSIHKVFNPVLYTEKYFYDLLDNVKISLDKKLDRNEELDSEELNKDFSGVLFGLTDDVEYAEQLKISLGNLKDLMKLTVFSENEDETFYREREWRKIGDFKFSNNDVEAVIVPKRFVKNVAEKLIKLHYKNTVVIPLELIEKV